MVCEHRRARGAARLVLDGPPDGARPGQHADLRRPALRRLWTPGAALPRAGLDLADPPGPVPGLRVRQPGARPAAPRLGGEHRRLRPGRGRDPGSPAPRRGGRLCGRPLPRRRPRRDPGRARLRGRGLRPLLRPPRAGAGAALRDGAVGAAARRRVPLARIRRADALPVDGRADPARERIPGQPAAAAPPPALREPQGRHDPAHGRGDDRRRPQRGRSLRRAGGGAGTLLRDRRGTPHRRRARAPRPRRDRSELRPGLARGPGSPRTPLRP